MGNNCHNANIKIKILKKFPRCLTLNVLREGAKQNKNDEQSLQMEFF